MAAGRLQEAGLILYARGRIKIRNRKGLEATVCECYQIVRDVFERLLGTGRKAGTKTKGGVDEAGD